MYRIESLLAARQFVVPQLVGDRIYFISNLSGKMSLYVMDYGGSVPEPLLPPNIALQNPHLMNGESFYVFPELGRIIVMIDQNGDENYKPMAIPIEGGFPEDIFDGFFDDYRTGFGVEDGHVFGFAQSNTEPMIVGLMIDVENGTVEELSRSPYGLFPAAHTEDFSKFIFGEGYTVGDNIYLVKDGDAFTPILGTPISERDENHEPLLWSLGGGHFVDGDSALLFSTTRYDDLRGLAYAKIDDMMGTMEPVTIEGLQHTGIGEMENFSHLRDDIFLLGYNIDGVSWLYEATYQPDTKTVHVQSVVVGQGEISNGVLEHHHYEKETDRHIVSYSTATSPTQIYTIEGPNRDVVVQHTRERVLGIPEHLLSEGEDCSFESHDGLRVSARLYLPPEEMGYEGKRPLVYYIHGGPQSQERPDFAWFSMPLIQMLVLNGFAVFVPNVRGSTGYGLSYTKHVDRDWGGQDRLDHVYAMTEVLPKHPRVDTDRAGVVGRSYGGYMTLMLAFQHSDLWKGAIDMFGPYDMFTFIERIPPTWRPYFEMSIGHPERDRDALTAMSPKTYQDGLDVPMLVIQGANDPRVVRQESVDLVENLKAKGKNIDILVFEDEGHDVIKYDNKVTCYNTIIDFFSDNL